MAGKRVLVIDAYNVIKVLREVGVSFEEIAALGCRIEGEPALKATAALVAVWYEEEKEEREKAQIVV
jgi:hypothetical protein